MVLVQVVCIGSELVDGRHRLSRWTASAVLSGVTARPFVLLSAYIVDNYITPTGQARLVMPLVRVGGCSLDRRERRGPHHRSWPGHALE